MLTNGGDTNRMATSHDMLALENTRDWTGPPAYNPAF
jgi:hypothetical protein